MLRRRRSATFSGFGWYVVAFMFHAVLVYGHSCDHTHVMSMVTLTFKRYTLFQSAVAGVGVQLWVVHRCKLISWKGRMGGGLCHYSHTSNTLSCCLSACLCFCENVLLFHSVLSPLRGGLQQSTGCFVWLLSVVATAAAVLPGHSALLMFSCLGEVPIMQHHGSCQEAHFRAL